MAYNNCSYHEANKIIEGKENKEQEYDRYTVPTKWPSLPTRRTTEKTYESVTAESRKMRHEGRKYTEDRPRKELADRQDKYNYQLNKIETKEKREKTQYISEYPRINNREEEVAKGRKGIIINNKGYNTRTDTREIKYTTQDTQQDVNEYNNEQRIRLVAGLLELIDNRQFREIINRIISTRNDPTEELKDRRKTNIRRDIEEISERGEKK